MILRRTLFFVLLLITTCSISFAAVTLSDDNDVMTKTDDPRLDQKVSCDSEGLPVYAILAQLSQSTGVDMAAGLDKDDWMVQDRKVIVHVTDMKLRDLLREFGSVLKFHWSRGGERGKWTYVLWQDKQQRTEEQSLRDSAEDAQAKQRREKRENFVADITNLGSLSESSAAVLKATDPWRYILATEPLGGDVAGFINAFPDARNAFVQGSEASFPVSTLPPQVQDMVRRIAVSYDSLTKSVGASEDHSDLLNKFDKLQITINRRTSGAGGDIISQSLLGRITIGSGFDSLDVPLFDPSSATAKALGKAIVSLKSGMSKDQVGKHLETDMAAALQEKKVSSEASRDISSDPYLKTKVKLFDVATNSPLTMTLKNLAEKTKLDIISDYYPSAPLTVAAGEKTLGETLESIRTIYGSNWTKTGNLLRFTDKDWFKKRAWEIPQVWLNYWKAEGKANNGLQLWDLVQIGCLRDEQIDHTIITNQDMLVMGAGDAARNRQILRFYGMLKDDQVQKLSNQSLPISSLTDDQWTALQKALATKGAAYAAVQKGSQTIQLIHKGSDATEHRFVFYPGGNDPSVEFKIVCGVLYDKADDKKPSANSAK